MNTVNAIDIEALGEGEAARLEPGGAAGLRGLGAVRSAGRGRGSRHSGPAEDPRLAAIPGMHSRRLPDASGAAGRGGD